MISPDVCQVVGEFIAPNHRVRTVSKLANLVYIRHLDEQCHREDILWGINTYYLGQIRHALFLCNFELRARSKYSMIMQLASLELFELEQFAKNLQGVYFLPFF